MEPMARGAKRPTRSDKKNMKTHNLHNSNQNENQVKDQINCRLLDQMLPFTTN